MKPSGIKIEIEKKAKFCDFCEREIDGLELDHSLTMHFSFGYPSNRDGQEWDWDSCNLCAEKIIKKLESLRKNVINDEYTGAD